MVFLKDLKTDPFLDNLSDFIKSELKTEIETSELGTHRYDEWWLHPILGVDRLAAPTPALHLSPMDWRPTRIRNWHVSLVRELCGIQIHVHACT